MAIPKKKIVLIETIPTKNIGSEWITTFEKLQQIVLPVYCLPDIEDRGLRKFIDVETARWRIILHWVAKKKWNAKLKVPGGRKIAASLEPIGEHMCRVLELCVQLHRVGEYSNAADWFGQIIDEVRSAEIQAFVHRSRKNNEGEAQVTRDICSNISGSLRGYERENPFDCESEPHIWRLVESALKETEKSERFRKTYWKDFLNSLAEINKKRKKGGSTTLVGVEDVLVACGGQGRGKKIYF